MNENILGIIAGVFPSISMMPQLIKVIREKDVSNISLGMLLILITGLALWVVYGVLKTEWPIILTNALAVTLNTILLIFYFKFK
ncbi:MAG: SemiSWEET transporter [Weeksellaceae bacterium]|nr:SemiSWEET transporter [Weeksellaceae bacterium]